jgi:hypothetical protein
MGLGEIGLEGVNDINVTGYMPVARPCEHGNTPQYSIKDGEYLD